MVSALGLALFGKPLLGMVFQLGMELVFLLGMAHFLLLVHELRMVLVVGHALVHELRMALGVELALALVEELEQALAVVLLQYGLQELVHVE